VAAGSLAAHLATVREHIPVAQLKQLEEKARDVDSYFASKVRQNLFSYFYGINPPIRIFEINFNK
jgi:hypothetical protein